MPADYYYRRPVGASDLLPAVGAGVVAGLAVFYVARLFLQRTPLLPGTPNAAAVRPLAKRAAAREVASE